MKKDKYLKPWKDLAERWKKWTPPLSPSKEAISVYKKFIIKSITGLKRKPRALVLGATPQLRDLLFELNFEVTIIDVSMKMILAMSELTKHKNPDEVIVKSDWMKMPLTSDYYDIVVGDIILGNVPQNKQVKFLKEIQRVLKKKGYWITRMIVVNPKWSYEEFNKILNRYAHIHLRSNTSTEFFLHLFCNI